MTDEPKGAAYWQAFADLAREQKMAEEARKREPVSWEREFVLNPKLDKQMLEHIRKLFEDGKVSLSLGGRMIASSADRPHFETGELRGWRTEYVSLDPATPSSDRTVILYSDFVEPGTIYVTRVESIPPSFDFKAYERDVVNRIAHAFEVPGRYWFTDYFRSDARAAAYDITRGANESVLSWGARLFERGLLDDPAIRWLYQRAVLGTPVRALRHLLRRNSTPLRKA